MPRSDGPIELSSPRIDWRSWLTLAWVIGFGSLYARMVLQERAPGLWDLIRGFLPLD
ncbi:hypothetical protein [Tautonia marina]|uniref:hypothetical protein n=1 Tax=Tautonia marina TaxID=2653855 RepID=UPI00137646FF|nr:hypothetical protein [Tautonia marina]